MKKIGPCQNHIFDRFSKIVGNSNVLVPWTGSFGTVRVLDTTVKLSMQPGCSNTGDLFCFLIVSALRVHPAVTWLTAYRRPQVLVTILFRIIFAGTKQKILQNYKLVVARNDLCAEQGPHEKHWPLPKSHFWSIWKIVSNFNVLSGMAAMGSMAFGMPRRCNDGIAIHDFVFNNFPWN